MGLGLGLAEVWKGPPVVRTWSPAHVHDWLIAKGVSRDIADDLLAHGVNGLKLAGLFFAAGRGESGFPVWEKAGVDRRVSSVVARACEQLESASWALSKDVRRRAARRCRSPVHV